MEIVFKEEIVFKFRSGIWFGKFYIKLSILDTNSTISPEVKTTEGTIWLFQWSEKCIMCNFFNKVNVQNSIKQCQLPGVLMRKEILNAFNIIHGNIYVKPLTKF